MKKSFLSILFALALCLSLAPMALAAETPTGTPLTASMHELSGGSYYLDNDLTIEQTIQVTGTVTLDLNGHVLKMESYTYSPDAATNDVGVIEVGSNAKLTLNDSAPTAKHYVYALEGSNLWRWDAEAEGQATQPDNSNGKTYSTVTGGIITGGRSNYGGGIHVVGNSDEASNSKLTMNGGNIIGCTSVCGGGVYVGASITSGVAASSAAGGKFVMNGGSIIGCAAGLQGAGVFVYNNSSFTMNDGSIHHCTCAQLQDGAMCLGGGVYSSGSFTMKGGSIQDCEVKSNDKYEPGAAEGKSIYLESETLSDVVPAGYVLSGTGIDLTKGICDANVTAMACPSHTLGADGKCSTCEAELKVSVTVGTDESAATSYYTSLADALDAANKASGETTVKALTGAGNSEAVLTISRSMTLDMNGKTPRMKTLDITGSGTVVTIQNTVTTTEATLSGVALNVNGGSKLKVLSGCLANTVTVKSGGSAEISGGTLTKLIVDVGGSAEISGGTFTYIINRNVGESVQDLLKAGYAYRQYEGTTAKDWYCDEAGTVSDKTLVVEAAPIQSVSITASSTSVIYGYDTAPILRVNATTAANGIAATYQWYKDSVSDNSKINDATTAAYTVPTGLSGGEHKFICAVTADGYTVNRDSTITVTKATLTESQYGTPSAKTDLTYNAQEQVLVSASAVTLPDGAKYLYSFDRTNWKEISEIKGKDAKSYTVYWKIDGGKNYEDVTDTTPLTATIAPFDISNVTSGSTPYFKAVYSEVSFDGTQKTLEPTFKLMASSASDAETLETLVEGTDYNYTLSSALSGTAIGAYGFTVTAAGSNYTGSHTYYWNIVKGTKPTLENINVNAKCSDSSVTVQVDQLLSGMPANAGALTFGTSAGSTTGSVTLDSFIVDGGKAIVRFSNGAAGDTITLPLFVASENYKDAAFDVVITLTDKENQAALTVTSANTATYRTSLQLTAEGGSGSGQVSWSVVNGTGSAVINDDDRLFPTKVGTVTVMATRAGDNTHNEVYSAPMTITIGKLQLSGEPRYTLITTSGKTLADANLRNNESWKVSSSIGWVDADGNSLPDDSTPVQPNTEYRWRFTVDEMDADGCEPTTLTGTVTLWTRSSGGSSGSSNPTVSTETTTTPDGSTVKTETKKDGTVIETVKSPDGSTTKTETRTETKKDGTVVETVKETVTGKDGSTSTTEVKTETKPDGSSTETRNETTKSPDGTRTETKTESKTDKNGVTSTTETKKTTLPDGSSSTTTTVTDESGSKTTASVTVSSKAAKSGETVTLPVEVPAENGEGSTTVNVTVPAGSGSVTVKIPVSNVTPGTVVVIVNADGSETVISSSKVTENGIEVTLEKSATLKIVDGSKRFGDVKDTDFFRDAVQWASSRGITGGIGGGKFGPHLSTERAQLVTMLYRFALAAGIDMSAGEDTNILSYADALEVPEYAVAALQWAVGSGIIQGADGKLLPNDAITREQMAVILYRFAQAVGMDTTQGGMAAREFADYESVSDYAREAMQWAVGAGIIQGADGKLLPGDVCTRGQIVTMLYRLLGK